MKREWMMSGGGAGVHAFGHRKAVSQQEQDQQSPKWVNNSLKVLQKIKAVVKPRKKFSVTSPRAAQRAISQRLFFRLRGISRYPPSGFDHVSARSRLPARESRVQHAHRLLSRVHHLR
eukprot:858582-Pleurochrysis_carterae.AAC.2